MKNFAFLLGIFLNSYLKLRVIYNNQKTSVKTSGLMDMMVFKNYFKIIKRYTLKKNCKI